MINLEQAASRAKEFLATIAGVPMFFTVLEDVRAERDTWVVSYRYTPIVGEPVIYTVSVAREDGKILEYSKSTTA